jgi:hypothetical protein
MKGIMVGDEYIRWSQMYKFTGVQYDNYWTSTACITEPSHTYAWFVDAIGQAIGYYKTSTFYVWPVRVGQ